MLKEFNNIETLYFDLSENPLIFSVLKTFLSKYDNLKLLKHLILKIN